MASNSSTRQRLKEIIVESLNLEGMSPDKIEDDVPLWGDDGLGLDSVDALELMVALEKEYGFRIDSENLDREALATVARLQEFVDGMAAAHGAPAASAVAG